METPNTVEESLRVLLREIGALQVIRDKVASTNEYSNTMHSWLMNVKEKIDEVIGLEEKFIGCRTFRLRYMFNRKVLDLLKFVHVQKEVGTALYDSSKTLCSEPNRFTLASLNSFTSNFSQNIHSHCSENVYRGQFPNGVQVVVKKLTEIDVVEDVFILEVNKLLNVFHRNLVRFYGFCFEKSMKALVFEYVPNGSLDRILFDNYNNYIQWELLYDIVTETAKGLSYLHDGCVHQLLHCDLKASNVLLDSNMKPKVTNFGLSKLLSKDLTHLTISKDQGDPSYPAPEIMTLSSCVTEKCDVYSFGLMLLEVLGKRRVVSGGVYFPRFVWNIFEKEGMGSVIKECGITVNKEKAMILCMVAFWCIQYTPENRPSMSTVIKMLDRQIKVGKPPSPFFPDFPYSVKSFADVNYKSSDFGSNLYESHLSDLLEAPENSGPALGTEQPSSTGGLLHTHTGARSFRFQSLDLDSTSKIAPQLGMTVMENPSRLEENLEVLAREMAALKYCRTEVATKEAQRMEGWLKSIESKENDFDEIQRELKEIRGGHHSNNLHTRLRLNRRVIENLEAVTVLKEGVHSASESIETLLSDLSRDKPRRFTHGNLKSFTSNFKTTVDTDPNGNVYKGQFPNGLQIVVKVLTEKDAGEEIFMAQVNTMFKTSHRHLVKLYGFCFDGNTKALVYEFMQNSSLDKILYKNHHSDMEWEQLHGIAIQAAKGLSYLHDGCDDQIIHHDVKASNVLLDSTFSSKITNFGVAKLMSRDKTHLTLTRTRVTPGYAAPEMWIPSSPITYKCDVYSFGMMLFEILARKSNYETKKWQPKTIWERYQKGQLDELIEECGIGDKNKEKAKTLCMVAFWCSQFTQQNRPSMSTVVKMLEMEIPVSIPPNPFMPSAV